MNAEGGLQPRPLIRAAMFAGAYILAAALVGIWGALQPGSAPSPFINPLHWPFGLWVFPLGLSLLFNWHPAWSYAAYAALAVQVFVPSRRLFFGLFGLLIATLCLNVGGCVKGVAL